MYDPNVATGAADGTPGIKEPVTKKCFVETVTAFDAGAEWARTDLEDALKNVGPRRTTTFVECGKCATRFALDKEVGSISAWPPGCIIGLSLD